MSDVTMEEIVGSCTVDLSSEETVEGSRRRGECESSPSARAIVWRTSGSDGWRPLGVVL